MYFYRNLWTCKEGLEEEGSELVETLSIAAKRRSDAAKKSLDEAALFKNKIETALAGAKIYKSNLDEYLKLK